MFSLLERKVVSNVEGTYEYSHVSRNDFSQARQNFGAA